MEFCGKIEEFILRSTTKRPVFSVIFGHFRSFSVVFAVIPGYDSDFFPFSFLFIPFHSFLLHKHTNFSGKQNFFLKIFGSSKYSPYLCHRLTDDSSLSGRATVSPKASSRRLFLCQRISSQLENFIFLTGKVNMAAS